MVKGFKLVKPPKDILERFNSLLGSYFKKVKVNLNQNQELAQLRDWMLPMLMNGQVKVEDTYGSSELQTNIAAEAATAYQN
jgi:type I restriction enzyme S subunit